MSVRDILLGYGIAGPGDIVGGDASDTYYADFAEGVKTYVERRRAVGGAATVSVIERDFGSDPETDEEEAPEDSGIAQYLLDDKSASVGPDDIVRGGAMDEADEEDAEAEQPTYTAVEVLPSESHHTEDWTVVGGELADVDADVDADGEGASIMGLIDTKGDPRDTGGQAPPAGSDKAANLSLTDVGVSRTDGRSGIGSSQADDSNDIMSLLATGEDR